MTAFKGLGTYGDGVGVVTPLDQKMAHTGLIVKTSTPMVVRSGLFYLGVTSIVAGAAGMSYSVAAYLCATQRSASAGVVLGGNDGTVSVATTAAPGADARYDVIYHWPREFALDGGDSTPVIGVVQGAASALPAVPSLAAFPGAIELARVLVPAGVTATNSGTTITQTAPFTAVDGGVVPFRNKTAMDLWTTALTHARALDLATDLEYSRSGSAWATKSAPFCSLRKTANQNLTTSATALIWDVEAADTAGMHDNATNNTRIYAPIAGVYELTATLFNSNTSGLGTAQGRLNGSTDIAGSIDRRTGDGSAFPLHLVFPVVMAAGDYLEVMVLHASAAGNIVGGTLLGSAVVTVKWLGPAS